MFTTSSAVAPVDSVTVDEYLKKHLQHTDKTMAVKIDSPPLVKGKTPTKSNKRAKLGFRYWYLDPRLNKPNPGTSQ